MEPKSKVKNELPPRKPIYPACFGDPDHVFQEKQKGVIKPHDDCLPCSWVRKCFQLARQLGPNPKPPAQERPTESRLGGFLKRWASQKAEKLPTQTGNPNAETQRNSKAGKTG